jgi:archaemetzincin
MKRLLLLLLLCLISADAAADEPPVLCVQPFEPYPTKMLPAVARGIKYVYGFKVDVLEPRRLPKVTWYAPRKRHRADQLLDWMRTELLPKHSHCRWILGLTRADISVTKGEHKDWGVLGLGEMGGRVAMVSSFRTHKKLRKPHTALRRTVKVANHEIGHMMGLPHVKGAGCLMNDAEGSVLTTDQETGLLCQPTVDYIEKKQRLRIPKHTEMDWSKVESHE